VIDEADKKKHEAEEAAKAAEAAQAAPANAPPAEPARPPAGKAPDEPPKRREAPRPVEGCVPRPRPRTGTRAVSGDNRGSYPIGAH